MTQTPPLVLLDDTATGIALTVQDGVAIATLDQPGSPVNTLNTRVGPVFEQILARVEGDSSLSGLVIVSAKSDTWIAGADIDELQKISSAAQGEALSRAGQQLLNRLAACSKPSSPRCTARRSAVDSRSRWRAAIASRVSIRRRCSRCRKCSSASFPAPAARSGCRDSWGCKPHWT